jgi:hypothetical protein
MSKYDWSGDVLSLKEPDVRDPKRDILWQVFLEKHGGWWYKIFKNGQFAAEGASESKREAREAAEKTLQDLMSVI